MLVDKFATSKLCQHIKVSGDRCGAPARKGRKYCIFHESMHQKRPSYSIPMAEDAMSLQLGLMQIIRALINQAIDPKTAALALYGLQIASGNLKRFAVEQTSAADDPARQQSLAELLLERLGIPETPEQVFADYDGEMSNPVDRYPEERSMVTPVPPEYREPTR